MYPLVTILLEPDAYLRERGARALREAGLLVAEVGTAEDALDLMRHVHCDLLVVAGSSEADLKIAWRARKLNAHLKIVCALGAARLGDTAVIEICDGRLARPYGAERLAAEVTAVLQQA
jgi:hypothetical protein